MDVTELFHCLFVVVLAHFALQSYYLFLRICYFLAYFCSYRVQIVSFYIRNDEKKVLAVRLEIGNEMTANNVCMAVNVCSLYRKSCFTSECVSLK